MKTIFKYILASCFFSSFIVLSAQANKLDSLLQLLKTTNEDTVRVRSLLGLTKYYADKSKYDSTLHYASQSFMLSERLGYKKGKANSYFFIGLANYKKGNYDIALENYFSLLKIADDLGDRKFISNAYNNMGSIYMFKGLYPDALKYHFLALKIREELADKKSIAGSFSNIGIVYFMQENYQSALVNYFKAIDIKHEMNDTSDVHYSNMLMNVGAAYEKMGKLQESLDMHHRCLKIKLLIDDKRGIAGTYGNIGNVFLLQASEVGRFDSVISKCNRALRYYEMLLKLSEEIEDKEITAETYLNMSKCYFLLKKYDLARDYGNKSLTLSLRIGSNLVVKESYAELSKLDSVSGNWKGALANYKNFVLYRDSLINEENTKKTVQSQMQYEFDKKEAATRAEAEKNAAIAESEKRKQRVILYAVISGLAVVLLFAGFIFRSLRVTRKQKVLIEQQKHLVEEKQKEILDSIHYARRIQTALLPTERYIGKTLMRLLKNT